MQRKVQLVTNEFYHVLNRGIDGRNIFTTNEDYQRFLECLEEFNTPNPVTIRDFRISRISRRNSSVNYRRISSGNSGNRLVDIICFCLMPNHFHLLLKQLVENGITTFMRKLGTGYANYFNTKYERRGRLFQGAFEAVMITKENHFFHISRYIHLNVLDLYEPSWHEGKVTNWERAKQILEQYPWSSYPAFVGKKVFNFLNPLPIKEMFKDAKEYEDFLMAWTKRDLDKINAVCLE